MTEQPRHVFVDASGRRAAWLRWSGWAVTALVSAYLLLLAAALVGPPGLSRLAVPGLRGVLPEVGPAQLGDATGGSGAPQDVLEQAGPAPTPRPTDPPPVRTDGPSGSGGGQPGPSGSPTAATPGPTTSAPPSATKGPGNRPSTSPGQATSSPATASPSASAPGNGQGTGKPTDTPSRRPTVKPTRSPRA